MAVTQVHDKTTLDVAGALGRIEVKIDHLNNQLMKIVYALIGVVAATVGVEFLPKSPVDWHGGISKGFCYVTILVLVFLVLRMFQVRKQIYQSKYFICLILGIASFTFVYSFCAFVGFSESCLAIFLVPVKLFYVAMFFVYALKIEVLRDKYNHVT